MKRLLFICGKCRQRSPTAEHIFSEDENIETDSAGLCLDADVNLGKDQIDWATHIIIMKKAQANKLRKNYKPHLNGKKLVCLDIPDKFDYMQKELIDLLKLRISRVV